MAAKGAIAIGASSTVTGVESTAVGENSMVSSSSAVAIGNHAVLVKVRKAQWQ